MHSLSVIPNRITAFDQRERQRYDNSVLITYCWLFIFRKKQFIAVIYCCLGTIRKKTELTGIFIFNPAHSGGIKRNKFRWKNSKTSLKSNWKGYNHSCLHRKEKNHRRKN